MSKKHRIVSLFVCLLLALTVLAVPALAAPSDFTVTVSTDAEEVQPGDIVTVNVTVTGAQFCAAQMELSYDADSFAYISSMSGWSDERDGRLSFLNVIGFDGYWEDGKVLGTFKFMVKENASAGKAAFNVGKDSKVFIIGDWAEGASSEPAEPLGKNQFINAAVNIAKTDGSAAGAAADFGAISDDGNTINLEAGHRVYSIPDTGNGQVVWKSSDESVVTVDENGLVTAVSDGEAIITATDKDGNELEQRTIVVGDMPEEAAAADGTAEQTPDESADKNTERPGARLIVIAAAVVIVIAAIAVVLSKKQRTKTR